MEPRVAKQGLIWGSVLILVGILSLVNQFVELSPWIWILALAAAGLGAFGFYLSDRSDWFPLLASYILWTIAVLIALVTLDVLRDEAVAVYVLIVIALPFLAVFLRDRRQWAMLIPAYVLMVVAVMIGLMGLGLLNDLLVPAYVLLAIAIPFFVVYVRDRRQWWFLIPGGILAAVGLSFLIAEAAIEYIGAVVLLVVGVWILVRVFTRGEPTPETEALTAPEEKDEPRLE